MAPCWWRRRLRRRAVRSGQRVLDRDRVHAPAALWWARPRCCSTAPSSSPVAGLSCDFGVFATGSAELYVPAGVTPPSGLPREPAHHQSTPTPIPTAIPTPFPPEAGVVPPGAGLDRHGRQRELPARDAVRGRGGLEPGLMGRLVGSVTPNVVPHRTTVEVTFLLPAKAVEGWGIFVTPIPGISGLPVGGPECPWQARFGSGPDGGRRLAEYPLTVSVLGRQELPFHTAGEEVDMNPKLAAVVVVAVFAITGCTTGQPSAGGSAAPSTAAPSTASTPTTSPPSPVASPAIAVNSRWPARCRHLQDGAVGHGLPRAPAGLLPIT